MTQRQSPPLVFVLTEVSIKLLLVQFTSDDETENLINAVSLGYHPLWCREEKLNKDLLVLVLVFVLNIEEDFGMLRYKGMNVKKADRQTDGRTNG